MIAIVEFVILLIVLVPRVVSSKTKDNADDQMTNNKRKKDEGRTGTIKNLDFALKGIMGCGGPVTTFQIHESDGRVFYGGVDGHDYDLSKGSLIEFWPSSESIANENIRKSQDNEDGTKSTWQENVRYYRLKKYRLLPDVVESLAPEAIMEASPSEA